jgi:hypothetical protein
MERFGIKTPEADIGKEFATEHEKANTKTTTNLWTADAGGYVLWLRPPSFFLLRLPKPRRKFYKIGRDKWAVVCSYIAVKPGRKMQI